MDRPEVSAGGTTSRRLARRCVVWDGEVDVVVAPSLLVRTLESSPTDGELVIDLRAVEFMDAAGISALVRARTVLRRSGSDLRVRHPPRRVLKLLTIFDLLDLVEPDVQDPDADG